MSWLSGASALNSSMSDGPSGSVAGQAQTVGGADVRAQPQHLPTIMALPPPLLCYANPLNLQQLSAPDSAVLREMPALGNPSVPQASAPGGVTPNNITPTRLVRTTSLDSVRSTPRTPHECLRIPWGEVHAPSGSGNEAVRIPALGLGSGTPRLGPAAGSASVGTPRTAGSVTPKTPGDRYYI